MEKKQGTLNAVEENCKQSTHVKICKSMLIFIKCILKLNICDL